MENKTVNIYIDSAKAYYYPGEQFLASILLDVLDTVNSNEMIIIAKGKQIIKATQKRIFEDTEENFTVNEDNEEDEDDEEDVKMNEPITEIEESKNIFKYSKVITISNSNYLEKGKYSFPFEVELPKDIPGSFLFLESKTYAEIIYSIKVKLKNTDIKESIPIIVRQTKEIFNYLDTSEYTKNIPGCCCEVGQSTIKLNLGEDHIINGNDISLNVNINNTRSQNSCSALNVEIYQYLILKNKQKNRKIKITKVVGKYKGNKIIDPGEDFNKNITMPLTCNNYVLDHLSNTKSIKCFKHKSVIPLLNQSIKSDFITNEYEIYAESQFSNLTGVELGVFLNILIYPPEKGILSKTISKISKEFSENIVNNKKIFLNNDNEDNDHDFKHKNENEIQSIKESKKSDEIKSNEKVKMIDYNKEENINEKKDEQSNSNNIIKKSVEIENDNISNANNINENFNNLNNNDINNKKSNIMTDEISFGTSTKDKANLFNIDTTSNNIKKNFNQDFLNDALDDEFMDEE